MVPARDIAQMLAERMEALAPELLPGGRRTGRDWRCGSVAGEAGTSMVVCLAGERRGRWKDHQAGEGGDALDLVQSVLGGDTRQAIEWAKRWLGLDDQQPDAIPRRPAPAPVEEPPQADPVEKREAIWARCQHWLRSPAETYIATRHGWLHEDADVRYMPPTDRRPQHLMVALVTDFVTAAPLTLHFTEIVPDGAGWRRGERKLMAGGRKVGGVIRLYPDADVDLGLGLAEGIETAASVMASGWRPVWSTIDAGNMADLPVLPGLKCLSIFADHDRSGTGQRAADRLAERWRRTGRSVAILAPPVTGTDWNDIVADREIAEP
jgi:phage/plasmid primase-like uncharacterized protein